MKILIIDGQGGALGKSLISALVNMRKSDGGEWKILAVGTNSAATVAMIGAGADNGATGENPALLACRDADVISGPLGIVVANSMFGEITPKISTAVGESGAKKILIPVSKCGVAVAGTTGMTYAEYVKKAADMIKDEVDAVCRGDA